LLAVNPSLSPKSKLENPNPINEHWGFKTPKYNASEDQKTDPITLESPSFILEFALIELK
jgi:hypothetical protein